MTTMTTDNNLSEIAVLARLSETEAARRLLDARISHVQSRAWLKDAAAELGTTYQTMLKWEDRLSGVRLVSESYPKPIELPTGKVLPKKATYADALAALEAIHADPEAADLGPAPRPDVVAKLLKEWLGKQRASGVGDTLAELGSAVGIDRFYLSRIANGRIKRPCAARLRRVATFLGAQAQ